MSNNVGRLRAHHSPLQAPPPEYQCSSSGNSSRTAIREKKLHFAAEGQGAAAADLCRTTVSIQTACPWTIIMTWYVL